MSLTHVGAELRRLVVRRAEGLCEYCLIHETDAYFGCQIDHIISEKHGGPTTAENLAYACLFCNRAKGSDIGSIVPATGEFVRFFNPRTDSWSEHFALREGMRVTPLTDIGIATERILAFNDGPPAAVTEDCGSQRLLERQTLYEEGRFPTATAQLRIREATS